MRLSMRYSYAKYLLIVHEIKQKYRIDHKNNHHHHMTPFPSHHFPSLLLPPQYICTLLMIILLPNLSTQLTY